MNDEGELGDQAPLLLTAVPRSKVAEPKYWALKESLLKFCSQNRPGTLIPPERRLAEQFGISRMTVRQALHELVIDGHLSRAHGRGTFVAPPKLTHVIRLDSTSEAMRVDGVVPTTRILAASVIAASGAIAEQLRLAPDAPVTAIERLRYANGETMALDYSYFDATRFPGLAEHVKGGRNLWEILEVEYASRPVEAEETIETSVASPTEAMLLDTETGAPLLLVQRRAFLPGQEPIEWSRVLFRGDRYRFRVHLSA